MAYFATLKLGNNDSGRYNREYPIISVRGHYSRQHNDVVPTSSASCDGITVTMPVPNRNDLELYDWFTGRGSLSGCIEILESFSAGSDDSSVILFENARCFSIREEYNEDSEIRATFTLEFMAEQVTSSDVTFDRLKM